MVVSGTNRSPSAALGCVSGEGAFLVVIVPAVDSDIIENNRAGVSAKPIHLLQAGEHSIAGSSGDATGRIRLPVSARFCPNLQRLSALLPLRYNTTLHVSDCRI